MAPKHDVGPRRTGSAGQQRRSEELPRDRFDELPKRSRVGAHRIVGKPKRFMIYLISALVGIAVLTAAGVVGVMVTGANMTKLFEQAAGQSREPEQPKVKAQLDPEASVVVLNGTTMEGFGLIVDELVTQNQWGSILFTGEASTSDVARSAVFYSDPADEAAALGLAKQLGGMSVYQSENYGEYGARLIVLLGADYAGPGKDRFVEGGVYEAAAAVTELEPATVEETAEGEGDESVDEG